LTSRQQLFFPYLNFKNHNLIKHAVGADAKEAGLKIQKLIVYSVVRPYSSAYTEAE
jgi:hypothetical protein